jgi:hypothetical protein
VIRALVPARIRPQASAPAAFWIKGGTRVPILEQRSQWWRVGWTHGQTGWMPAADLQPHATFVFIDARTGHVLRRLAAKGEQGAVSDGRFLWSFSDTGITRSSLTEPPAIWSNPTRRDPHGGLPEESVWTPDRSAFFLRENTNGARPLVEVSVGTGALRRVGDPGTDLRMVSADPPGRVLVLGEQRRRMRARLRPASQAAVGAPERVPLPGGPHVHLYSTHRYEEIGRAPGNVRAATKAGSLYADVEYTDGTRELIRYGADLMPAARLKLPGRLIAMCLSRNERVLALSYDDGDRGIELRRADNLTRIVTLHSGESDGAYPLALTDGADGWWILAGSDQEFDDAVTHYATQGQHVRSWDADARRTVMSPEGQFIYVARDSDLLVINTARGTTGRIPFTWRRPLPAHYLPPPSDPDSPTHMEISALTLTPDGRTLILTEWLNGDPEG